jgi:hypothetical protein
MLRPLAPLAFKERWAGRLGWLDGRFAAVKHIDESESIFENIVKYESKAHLSGLCTYTY